MKKVGYTGDQHNNNANVLYNGERGISLGQSGGGIESVVLLPDFYP